MSDNDTCIRCGHTRKQHSKSGHCLVDPCGCQKFLESMRVLDIDIENMRNLNGDNTK